jgi:uncharacterized membrane protein HdeD (DUF308 family)
MRANQASADIYPHGRAVRSQPMSEGLARNWWLVGLRALGALAFGIGIVTLPPRALASVIFAFSGYLAADGVITVLSGVRKLQRGDRWTALILEGASNLAVAAVVLAIPDLAIIPFLQLTSAWAVLTGALLLVAARRLVDGYGRWPLIASGALSIAWGVLEAAAGPASSSDAQIVGAWLGAYALAVGIALLSLAGALREKRPSAMA